MKLGRPVNWNPLSTLEPEVWSEVVALSSKSRLSLPVAIRSRVGWLSPGGHGLLAIVDKGGFAEIFAWHLHGETVMADLAGLLTIVDKSERGELALAAMDRYVKLTLDPDGRMVLPANLISDLDATVSQCVRVVARDSRLWLWSERRWQAERASRDAYLSARLGEHTRRNPQKTIGTWENVDGESVGRKKD